MVRRLVRADGRGDPRRRPRAKEQLMFDFLARLANGSARRVALLALAFFVLAGALGGSVASRLDPYGAGDPPPPPPSPSRGRSAAPSPAGSIPTAPTIPPPRRCGRWTASSRRGCGCRRW